MNSNFRKIFVPTNIMEIILQVMYDRSQDSNQQRLSRKEIFNVKWTCKKHPFLNVHYSGQILPEYLKRGHVVKKLSRKFSQI